MTAPISQEEAQQALEYIRTLALKQWKRDDYTTDLAEYEDAGMAVLSGCLERYDPQRDIAFPHYTRYRIRGAIQDARKGYLAWRRGRWTSYAHPWPEALRPLDQAPNDTLFAAWIHQQASTLPPLHSALLTALLTGETRAEIARTRGVTESAVLLQYRRLLASLRQRLWGQEQKDEED